MKNRVALIILFCIWTVILNAQDMFNVRPLTSLRKKDFLHGHQMGSILYINTQIRGIPKGITAYGKYLKMELRPSKYIMV